MNPKFFPSLVLGTLLAPQPLPLTYAQEAQPARKGRAASPAEQQVLAFGKDHKVNIFIDATDVPVETPAGEPAVFPPNYQSDQLNYIANNFTQQFEWSFLDYTPETYLFWQEPDAERIAQKVLQGEGYGAERDVAPIETLAALLQDYVTKSKIPLTTTTSTRTVNQPAVGLLPKRTETVTSQQSYYALTFNALPPELQQQIAAHIAQDTVSDYNPDYLGLWLRDELWTQARLFYFLPPRYPNLKTIFAAVWLQTPQGPQRVVLNLRQGGGSALAYDAKRDAGSQVQLDKQVDATTLGDRVQLLPLALDEANLPAASPPVFLPNPHRPPGSASHALKSTFHSPQLLPDDRLAKPLTFQATRLTLLELLGHLQQETGVTFQVDANVSAPTRLISLDIKDLATRDAMLAIARLYGLAWTPNADGTYALKSALRQPLDAELLRLGSPGTYRRRDFLDPLDGQDSAAFDDLARQVIDEAGPGILKLPGVPLSALAPETQAKIRAHVRHHLLRHLMNAQNDFLQYEADDLRMNFDPGNELRPFPSMWIDGKTRKTRGVSISLPELPFTPPGTQSRPQKVVVP